MTRYALALPLLAAMALPVQAGNVTNQQSCQLMARHVVDILESRDWSDEAATEIGVLDAFDAAQATIITAEVADSATQMGMPVADIQTMVDRQGEMLAASIEQRYGTEKLYRDYTTSLLNCAKMAPDQLGSDPETFVATLDQIGMWAQQGK